MLLITAILGTSGTARTAEWPSWPVELQDEVVDAARAFEGELGLYVEDLSTGDKYIYNAATPFYLASVVKLPVLVTAYRHIEAGLLRLDEEIVPLEEDLRDGSPVLGHAEPGARYAIADLLRLMMQLSDNGATDLLLKRLGTERVNATLLELGFKGFRPITSMLQVRQRIYGELHPDGTYLSAEQVLRARHTRGFRRRAAVLSELLHIVPPLGGRDLAEAYERYYASEVNSAPMEAVGALLARLGREELVSAAASRAMLELMGGCRTGRHRLRSLLPPDVALSHKTGTQHRRACNVGVLALPLRRVAVALCTKDFTALGDAEDVMAWVGSRIHDLLSALPPPQPPAPPPGPQPADPAPALVCVPPDRPAPEAPPAEPVCTVPPAPPVQEHP